ncbi:putative acetyltransferase [Bacillus sp. TS-2]|nr:putative acetyltransferase [Bacillus sp. TS-2]
MTEVRSAPGRALNERNSYFDNIKFFLIFLVVVGHVISPLKGQEGFLFDLYVMIYLFHMPAFIFVSGFFAKGYKKKGYLYKVFKKVLIPYFIFQLIYSVFYYLNGSANSISFDLFSPHWTMWFLFSLFCWNVLLFVFAKWSWAGLVPAIALGLGVGYFDFLGTYFSLSRTFVFFPFFLLGFLMKKEHFQKLKRSKYTSYVGAFILLITFILVYFFFPEEGIPWLFGSSSYADIGVGAWSDSLIRLSQYFISAVVMFSFLVIVPQKNYFFTIIGQRTMYIYLLHGFIIQLIQTFVSKNVLYEFAGNYVLLIGISLVICFICGSYYSKKLIPILN